MSLRPAPTTTPRRDEARLGDSRTDARERCRNQDKPWFSGRHGSIRESWVGMARIVAPRQAAEQDAASPVPERAPHG